MIIDRPFIDQCFDFWRFSWGLHANNIDIPLEDFIIRDIFKWHLKLFFNIFNIELRVEYHMNRSLEVSMCLKMVGA